MKCKHCGSDKDLIELLFGCACKKCVADSKSGVMYLYLRGDVDWLKKYGKELK